MNSQSSSSPTHNLSLSTHTFKHTNTLQCAGYVHIKCAKGLTVVIHLSCSKLFFSQMKNVVGDKKATASGRCPLTIIVGHMVLKYLCNTYTICSIWAK